MTPVSTERKPRRRMTASMLSLPRCGGMDMKTRRNRWRRLGKNRRAMYRSLFTYRSYPEVHRPWLMVQCPTTMRSQPWDGWIRLLTSLRYIMTTKQGSSTVDNILQIKGLKATKIAFSSIVGQSIVLSDGTGRHLCQLAILNPQGDGDYKAKANDWADAICAIINNRPKVESQ